MNSSLQGETSCAPGWNSSCAYEFSVCETVAPVRTATDGAEAPLLRLTRHERMGSAYGSSQGFPSEKKEWTGRSGCQLTGVASHIGYTVPRNPHTLYPRGYMRLIWQPLMSILATALFSCRRREPVVAVVGGVSQSTPCCVCVCVRVGWGLRGERSKGGVIGR